MNKEQALLEYLEQFLTEERQTQFDKVLRQRTKHFTVALENIYQQHNSNAVIRSCDCFGIQDCHVIETFNAFNSSIGVSKGAIKWVDVHKHENTVNAIKSLRNSGYQIVATTPHTNDCNLDDFDVTKKSVFFFGAEKKGLSRQVLDQADVYLKIPMVGQTESLNISVCAAIILQHVTKELRKKSYNWGLTDDEKRGLLLDWTKKSVRRLEMHLKKFEREWGKN